MPVSTILIILLLLAIVGALPTWGYSRGWGAGYYPSGGIGVILLIVIVLVLLGRF